MALTLVICSSERLDVVLHRGSVGSVSAASEDILRAARLEIVAPDGRWRLIADLDVPRCTENRDGTWVLAFDRRSGAIEALSVPRETDAQLVAKVRA